MTDPKDRMMQLARLARDEQTTDGERHNAGRALAKMVLERGAPEGVDAAEVARLRADLRRANDLRASTHAAYMSNVHRADRAEEELGRSQRRTAELTVRAENAERIRLEVETKLASIEHELAALRCAVAALSPEHLVELHARELEARASLDERRRAADEKLAKLDQSGVFVYVYEPDEKKKYSYANVTFDIGGMGTDAARRSEERVKSFTTKEDGGT